MIQKELINYLPIINAVWLLLLLLLITCRTLPAGELKEPELPLTPQWLPGDLNGDGVTDIQDALAAAINGMTNNGIIDQENAPGDVDKNGILDSHDAYLIALFAAGEITSFPGKEPETLIAPEDPRILYTGRFHHQEGALFAYPGSAITLRFKGTAITLLIEDTSRFNPDSRNHYTILVDQSPPVTLKIGEETEYLLATGLPLEEHKVTLFKRTEAFIGEALFKGFKIHGEALSPPEKPERKILFIGDSITCGYGNEIAVRNATFYPFTAENENNYTAYGAICARNLKAEYMAIAFSGKGIYREYGGSTREQMPELFERIIPSRKELIWDRTDYIPDVIVINLGTNDFAKGIPGRKTFTEAYIKFLHSLRDSYNKADIYIALGPMFSDSWPPGKMALSTAREYLKEIRETFIKQHDNRIFFVEFPPHKAPFGEDFHPSAETHKQMANTLTAAIKRSSGW